MQHCFSFGNKKRYNLDRIQAIRLGMRYKNFLSYKKQVIKNNIKDGVGACFLFILFYFFILFI